MYSCEIQKPCRLFPPKARKRRLSGRARITLIWLSTKNRSDFYGRSAGAPPTGGGVVWFFFFFWGGGGWGGGGGGVILIFCKTKKTFLVFWPRGPPAPGGVWLFLCFHFFIGKGRFALFARGGCFCAFSLSSRGAKSFLTCHPEERGTPPVILSERSESKDLVQNGELERTRQKEW